MYQQLKNKLRHISIEKRLVYSFFILSLIPIVIVGSLTVHIASRAIKVKSTNYIGQLMEAIEDNLHNELNNYEVLLTELMVNATIQQVFDSYEKSTYAERGVLANEINEVIIPKLSSYPYIRDIKMINLKNEVVYQRGYLLNDESHIEGMVSAIEEIGGNVQCFMQPIYNENYIIIAKRVNSTYTKEPVGYITFVLKETAIRKIYEKINLGEGANIYLIDDRQQLLSSQHEALNGVTSEELVQKVGNKVMDEKNQMKPYSEYTLDGYTYSLITENLKHYKIKCIANIPHSYLFKEIKLLMYQVTAIIVICFICFTILSKVISRSIIDPLRKLKLYIEQAMEERFNTIYTDDSPDELGVLGRSYVQINNEMHDMIKKIERDEKERRELELNMLQAQINPHFLFNTLNSLRWISMMSGVESVSEGILALSELLKKTIIQKAEYITIQSELENVQNYMLIQKLRYGDFFKVEWQTDEQFLKYQTLKFILQPIVENAIIHGMRDEQTILNIAISLKEEGEDLVIGIIDDGKGFDTSKARTKEEKDARLSGIGIHNVIERIRLNFGEQYGVDIVSCIGEGTRVKVRIPKIKGEKHV
ncbi:MAG: cache domain-containing sensor histidine kinase [Cellulosilyticaceae bacterium]